MTKAVLISAVRSIAGRAVRCRACFDLGEVQPAQISVAQPRWVGQDYSESNPRVAIVMLNPGSGVFRADSSDAKMLDLLREFAEHGGSLRAIFANQAADMPQWGAGRFKAFYLDGLNLPLRSVAFANIAWCATKGNEYPSSMLQRCFSLHTLPLLKALAPNIVLLSGSSARGFVPAIQRELSSTLVIPMLHYAHRGGNLLEAAELTRVRHLIDRIAQLVVPEDGAKARRL